MSTTVRLTNAQKRGLMLLAHPGAEARTARSIRWDVWSGGEKIGSIHSASLLALRVARLVWLVVWERGDTPLDFRQRITPAGRMYLSQQPPTHAYSPSCASGNTHADCPCGVLTGPSAFCKRLKDDPIHAGQEAPGYA